MSSFVDQNFLEEDDDAKADELPSDEEGDPMTGGHKSKDQHNINPKPKVPPPVLNSFASPLSLSLSQSDENTKSADVDESDIMAYSSNMRMRVHSNHMPSKTMPISLPLFWTCKVCTFGENALDSPVCSVCGSLPPFEENTNTKKQKQKAKTIKKQQTTKKKQNAQILSPRAYQPNHRQHKIWAFQQTRNRNGDQNSNHQRTHSEQISYKQIPNISQILPNFLEEDADDKDSNQPSLQTYTPSIRIFAW